MKKTYLFGLVVAALAGGALIQGCSGGTTCTTSTDCGADEICDVATSTCEAKSTATACTTDADCTTAGTHCDVDSTSATFNTCVANTTTACTTDTDCTTAGTHCDTASGTCVTTTTGGCSASAPCPSGQYCDSTGTCATGYDQCATPDTQDTCAAGSVCFDDPSFSPLPVCDQISNPDGSCSISNPPATNPATNAVIWNVAKSGSHADTTGACSGTVDEFTGNWYDASGNTVSGKDYSHLVIVTTSGSTTTSGGDTLRVFDNTGSFNSDGTFTFSLCDDNHGAAGVTIDNGTGLSNTACIPMPL